MPRISAAFIFFFLDSHDLVTLSTTFFCYVRGQGILFLHPPGAKANAAHPNPSWAFRWLCSRGRLIVPTNQPENAKDIGFEVCGSCAGSKNRGLRLHVKHLRQRVYPCLGASNEIVRKRL